jgi:DNA topoisomerase-1
MELTDENDETIAIKIGRYGVYLQGMDTNTTLPDDSIPSEISFETASVSLKKKTEGPLEICSHPESGEPIYLKEGRFGPYIQCGDKMKSLLPGMSIEEITPNIAKSIISLPKELGKHPDSGDVIKADTGRYGPYIRCGKTTRSVNAPDSILDLNLEKAVELLATAREKSGPRVIKELGVDPETKSAIEIKDGRYGPYVTDGKVNATLPKITPADDITLEIAIQLIADKKAKGPVRKKYFKRKS